MPLEPPIPRPTEDQREGYLVVRTRQAMVPWLERRMRTWLSEPDEWWAWLRTWHAALGVEDGSRYAGVDRDVLDRWPDFPIEEREKLRHALLADGMTPEQLEHLLLPLPDDLPDARASRLLTARLGPDPELWWPQLDYDVDLIPAKSLAAEILAACDVPADREILRVSRMPPARTPVTLGWDVAQWRSSHMSLVRDCFVLPYLHPPPDAALPELRLHLARLNENFLFDRIEDAQAFRDWYLPHDWAECFGPEEVHVIQVERVAVESASTAPRA